MLRLEEVFQGLIYRSVFAWYKNKEQIDSYKLFVIFILDTKERSKPMPLNLCKCLILAKSKTT